jgi:hypothetical protein
MSQKTAATVRNTTEKLSDANNILNAMSTKTNIIAIISNSLFS